MNQRILYDLFTYMSTIIITFAPLKQKEMNEKPLFEIEVLEEAQEFIESLTPEARKKIYYNIGKSRYYIDKEIFKKLENTDIWEFRTLYNKMAYRLFAFWDNGNKKLVVATHGIIKKTQKTPRKEIKKAENIREQYFKEKTIKIQ